MRRHSALNVRAALATLFLTVGLVQHGSCQVDDPSNENFLRRPFPSVTVIGDYLYIDGGEISQNVSGKLFENPYPSVTVNSTLSISLKTAWTNSSITYTKTPRTGPPSLKEGALWTDTSTGSFYAWGGSTSYFAKPPANEIWKFTANGQGGGAWSQTTPSTVVAFSSLVKPFECATATSAGSSRIGYCIGGGVSEDSDASVKGTYAIPGIVSFDMSSAAIANKSTTGLSGNGLLAGGKAVGVPLGPNQNTTGLLMVLGGAVSTTESRDAQVDFTSVPVYDPVGGKWHSQATTGSRPTPRSRVCAVGVQGDNGTYEIFIYGGSMAAEAATSDEVFVLSLPGFVFFKASSTGSTVRADHACAVAGKRQLISVGGTNNWLGYPSSLTDKDPWIQGIGVFDMTEMKWTSGFNPAAASYKTPSVVKQWYAEGGQASVVWSSDEVKNFFIEDPSNTWVPSPTGNSTNQPTQGPSSDTADSNNSGGSSGPSAGVIAGAVVGGVAFLAIIAALATFLLLRRRRRHQRQSQSQSQRHQSQSETAYSAITPGGGGSSAHPFSPASTGSPSTQNQPPPPGSEYKDYPYPPPSAGYYQGAQQLDGNPIVELPVPITYELLAEHGQQELYVPGMGKQELPGATSPTHPKFYAG